MPTARPIIRARLGAVDETVTTLDRSYTPTAPTTTPLSALSTGRPVVSSEPNVIVRMTKAIRMPSAVEGPGLEAPEP